MKRLRFFFLITGFTAFVTLAASAGSGQSKRHPWRPPFGLERIGSGTNEFEADALAHAEPLLNPVDLGAILVPDGWLLLGPGQGACVEAAAITRRGEEKQARLRTWFSSEPKKAVSIPFPLLRDVRAQQRVPLPLPPRRRERETLHVSLQRANGDALWQKTIPVMLVSKAPHWPRFGAVTTTLRYDPPISVRQEDGSFTALPYERGWDPSLQDVVVFLPNGTRFVLWRGACYVPFWAGRCNTGLSYEWAETSPPADGFEDCVEPLMDKELRYGRVEIIESTAARVHVRWRYQSCDFRYKIWGDSATEDFYFYPDGFGTRVLTLQSAPEADYELSEFIILTPQDAYPFSVLPAKLVDILFLDGEKREIEFPYDPAQDGAKMKSRDLPAVYRVRLHKDDPMTAIYFHPQDRHLPPVVFEPFKDSGQVVTPCYWGSHWPLARGQTTGATINDRIHETPAHNSLMSWARQRPPPLRESRLQTLDTLGRSRPMLVQTWAWLIGMTEANDEQLLARARSFAQPPSLEPQGARLDAEPYSTERRALRLSVEKKTVAIALKPALPCLNPVFELSGASGSLASVHLAGRLLPASEYAWDGHTLWLGAAVSEPTVLRLHFAGQ